MTRHLNRVCYSLVLAAILGAQLSAETTRPNIVYIMQDELGYYEPGFMGNPNIRTPNLDRLAAEGIIFRNMLAGSSVCAPTRCCFMTGKHSGHTSVRSNGGGTPLRADEVTIASMLKPLGYATGGFGKWGCGGRDSTGEWKPTMVNWDRNVFAGIDRAPAVLAGAAVAPIAPTAAQREQGVVSVATPKTMSLV